MFGYGQAVRQSAFRVQNCELDWNAACYCFACGIKPARGPALPSRFLEDPARMRWSRA